MTKREQLEIIINSLINGQRKQMVAQIEEYGLYDFWEDFKSYMKEIYSNNLSSEYFEDAVISYFRIKNR